MKALTYNVHGWQTTDGAPNVGLVAEVLASAAPDLVALNEVFHPDGAGERPLLQLAQRLGYEWAFGATQSSDPTRHPPYGNAFLSRWPIVAHAAHHLAPETSYGRRGLLEVRVLFPSGRPFTVYVTHLDHRSEQLRLEQWSAAGAWLQRDRTRPHLLMGDFNALSAGDYPTPESREVLAAFQKAQGWVPAAFDLVAQVLKAGYVDSQAAIQRTPTFPAAEPERRIDYIFAPVSLASTLRSCRPLLTDRTRLASDHLPVLADFDYPSP